MSSNHTIKKLISKIKSELNNIYPDEEIEGFIGLIFEKFCIYSKVQLHTNMNTELSEELIGGIIDVLNELKDYKPIQYILGNTEFYDLKFEVASSVLIPRQETEELVDWIIKDCNTDEKIDILDIGTGSGCIAISLAKFIRNSCVTGFDISRKALFLAKKNGRINNVEVSFEKIDILNPPKEFNRKFDIIVSNPPYVTNSEKPLMHKNVLDYEPELALFVEDSDPLVFYRKIAVFAKQFLTENGKLFFEINESFGKETIQLLENIGFHQIKLRRDLNGKDRMVQAILNNS